MTSKLDTPENKSLAWIKNQRTSRLHICLRIG
jgi:hypothetical protein